MKVAALMQALVTVCGPSERANATIVADAKRNAFAALSKASGNRIFASGLRINFETARKMGKRAFCDPNRQLMAE